MKLALYALATLSNLLVVLAVPDAEVGAFLRAYSLASMIFGVLVVFAFSTPHLIPILQRHRFNIALILLIGAVVSLVGESQNGRAVSYAAAILLADYYLTQCGSARHVEVYRWFLILSVVPALLPTSVETLPLQEWLVPLRTFGALAGMLSLGIVNDQMTSLRVERPILYIVATHLFYFGSLALIALWLSGPELRVWYVGAQIGEGLILKLMDFRIRRHSKVHTLVHRGVNVLSAGIGVVLAVLYWQPQALLVYAGALLGLNLVLRWGKFS